MSETDQEQPVRDFEREELISLRARATKLGSETKVNMGWARAYLRLADAADHLDAMCARSGAVLQEG